MYVCMLKVHVLCDCLESLYRGKAKTYAASLPAYGNFCSSWPLTLPGDVLHIYCLYDYGENSVISK